MSEELKPCPFCGGSANMRHLKYHDDSTRHYVVFCTNCRVCGPKRAKEAFAIAKWNNRWEPRRVICPGCGHTLTRVTTVPNKRCYCGTMLFFEGKPKEKQEDQG